LWISKDTISIFSYDKQKLFIINGKGKLQNSFSLVPGNPNDLQIKINKKEIYATSFADYSYSYHAGIFSFDVNYGMPIQEATDFENYFRQKASVLLNTSGSRRVCRLFSNFPVSYLNNYFYSDFDHYQCIDDKSQIILSFRASDSLFIYNASGQFIRSVYAGSQFNSKQAHFDINEKMNYLYMARYQVENPSYASVFYDRFRKLYYRGFLKGNSYTTKDGKVRQAKELDWTLIILDEDFKKIGEVEMDPAKNSLYRIYPVKEGLLVTMPLEDMKKKISYSLFKVSVQ